MSKLEVQRKFKEQMTKKNEEEWNDGTLEYWVKQNNSSWIFSYSIISLLQNFPFKF
jgi:hypothetical protein